MAEYLIVLAVAAFTLVTSPARAQSSNRFSSRTCEQFIDVVNDSCTGEAILVHEDLGCHLGHHLDC